MKPAVNLVVRAKAEVPCIEAAEVRTFYPSAYLLMKSGVRYVVVRSRYPFEEQASLVDYVILSDEQMNGGAYMPFHLEAKKLLKGNEDRIGIEWIPRDRNDICDVLSKQVLKDLGVVFRIQPEKVA